MNKLVLSFIALFLVISVAQAFQITSHEIYFFEDKNEIRMANGVIGLTAYKTKGLEQNRPTYFNSITYEEARANEEIYLEKFSNGQWKKVNFAKYSIELNEEEQTITKHYSNPIGESLDINYKLFDYGSPIKLSFEIWGFYGTYRLQWRVSEIDTSKVIDRDYKLAYVNEQTEENTPMSDIPITIDPPETIPDEYKFMIDYADFIEAVGWENIDISQEYDEDGNVTATTFILGEFNLEFWETLYLDPKITSGHTTNQLVSSMLLYNTTAKASCYQEKTTAYYIGDGDCRQDYTGTTTTSGTWNTSYPATNSYDGDWATQGRTTNGGNVTLNSNYKKPYSNPTSANLTTWIGGIGAFSYQNIPIPTDCFSQNPIQSRYNLTYDGSSGYNYDIFCYNSTAWISISNGWGIGSAGLIVEESIIWENTSAKKDYFISVRGDYESGTDDGAYLLNLTLDNALINMDITTKGFISAGENIPATLMDINKNEIYIGADNGKFGKYNPASNVWTQLTQNVFSTSDIQSLEYDYNNNVIYGGAIATGKQFGRYNITSNVWTDLSSTDTGGWAGTSSIYAIKHNPTTDLIYTGLAGGKFGVYNRTSNVWTDLSSTDTGNWVASDTVYSLAYNPTTDLIYTGINNGKFGVYNRTSNVWTDLSSTDPGDWVGGLGYEVRSLYYDSSNDLIYTGIDSGKFGVYNRTSNVWTDLSSTDTGGWATQVVRSITKDTTTGLIYTGCYGGRFGVYDPSTNVWTDLSARDVSDWMSGGDMFDITYNSINKKIYVGAVGRYGYYDTINEDILSGSKVVAIGGETTDRFNLIFGDSLNKLHFILTDGASQIQEKDSPNTVTWATKQAITGSSSLALTTINPRTQLMPNGNTIFATYDSNSDPKLVTYNATSDTFTVGTPITATSVNYGISSFFNNITNRTYVVWSYTGVNVTIATNETQFGYPTNMYGVAIGVGSAIQKPQIYKYNNTLFLFGGSSSLPYKIGYATCPATDNCNETEDWTTNKVIDNAYGYDMLYNSILSIDGEGIFIIPRTNSTTDIPMYIFNNNTWFRLDTLPLPTRTAPSSFEFLSLDYDSINSKIFLAYSDVSGSYYEVYADTYTLPDILLKAVDENGNAITTNQTLNVYCGSTFIKQVITNTGSIGVYKDEYLNAMCSTNSTTIQLLQNDYQEKNITVTRTDNLKGYTMSPDEVGWSINTFNRYDCTGESINNWTLFADNGTSNYTFTNQNAPRTYTVTDINLTGSINFTLAGNYIRNGVTDFDGGSYTNSSYAYIKTLSSNYTYVDSVQATGRRTGGCSSAPDSITIRYYYLDGTYNDTTTVMSGTCNVWRLHEPNYNPFPYKIVRKVELRLNGDSYPYWATNLTTYYSGVFKNVTIETTRPTNETFSFNPTSAFIQTYTAWDRRFDKNITNFYVDLSNSTYNITRQASGLQIDLEYSQVPKGLTTIHWFVDKYNDSFKNPTIACNSTGSYALMEYAGLQIQVFNEETLAPMTFNMTVYNSTNSVTFNNIVNTTWKNYTEIPNGDITVSIEAEGSEVRTFYNTMSSTTFWNLTGYLLNNTDGLIRSFTVVNSGYQVIPGANVKISRFISNLWVVVAEKITDDSGVAVFLMNPSYQYQARATYMGLTSGTVTIQPTQSAYTLIIPTGSTAEGYSGILSGVSYKITPYGLWLPVSNATTITFNVTCETEDLESFNMTLLGVWEDINGTLQNTTIYTGGSTSDEGGMLFAVINTTNITRVYGTFTIDRDSFPPYTFGKNWIVDDLSTGNVSLVASLLSFKNIPDSELSMSAKSFILLIVATAVMGTLFFMVGGFASGLAGAMVLTIGTVFGWFDYRVLIVVWTVFLGIVFLQRGV